MLKTFMRVKRKKVDKLPSLNHPRINILNTLDTPNESAAKKKYVNNTDLRMSPYLNSTMRKPGNIQQKFSSLMVNKAEQAHKGLPQVRDYVIQTKIG